MRKITTDKVEWVLADKLDPVSYAVNQHLDRLAGITQYYEACWGYGRLQTLVSDNMRDKWQAHIGKLNNAIIERDLDGVIKLVDGVARAYVAMEAEAVALGHEGVKQEAFSLQTKYGDVWVCKDDGQGQVMMGLGYEVLTPSQVVALYENHKQELAQL